MRDKTALKSRAIERLFPALFVLRHRREPHAWESILGLALVRGELSADRPPNDPLLNQIYNVAEDVKLALRAHELVGHAA